MKSQAFAAAFVLLSATPTPNLNALGTVLAGAPDSTWTEARISSDTLQGPFGATFYVNAEWTDQSDRDTVKSELLADHFVGGYGRTFDRKSPEAYIVEDVKAFPDAADATANYQWAMGYWHDPNDTANNVATPSIPNSFGQRYTSGDWKAIDIYFTKGDYEFTVSVGAKADYLPDVAIAQAVKVYDFAPSRDVLQAPPQAAAGSVAPAVAIVGAGGAILILVVVVVAAILIAAARRRSVPRQQVMMSPDGNYWWDGTTWQPVTRR